MPSIDLARLRKQTGRLADFFFAPEDFARNLTTVLDSYFNHTIRARKPASRDSKLPTHRTPAVVMQQIEHELAPLAAERGNADAALALADRLWDDASLESRLLAAYLLGHISPEEGPLLARLTAWTSQVRDVRLRERLLDSSLHRMRKEAPDMFLHMLGEWLRPERTRLWPEAIRAAISAIRDPEFSDLPALMEAVAPVVRAAPAHLQPEMEDLVLALFRSSPTEAVFLIRQILTNPEDPETVIVFRRMARSFPTELTQELRDLLVAARPGLID